MVISTKNNINIITQSQILMTKGNIENGVSIEGDIHIRANNVIKNGNPFLIIKYKIIENK